MIDALEISRHLEVLDVPTLYPQLRGYPLLKGGDAHRLDEILGKNEFDIEHRNIKEIRLALEASQGRSFEII
jgi:hypothetical protein